MWGIMGSMRTDTGTPAFSRSWAALIRSDGAGAFGSIISAIMSLSVVMVKATVAGTLQSRSSSRATRLLLVIIWILQLHPAKTSRYRLVRHWEASIRG
jgi:hypothetical protein